MGDRGLVYVSRDGGGGEDLLAGDDGRVDESGR
jgi:hypothetical protein